MIAKSKVVITIAAYYKRTVGACIALKLLEYLFLSTNDIGSDNLIACD